MCIRDRYKQARQQPRELVGQSAALRKLQDEIRLVGDSPLTVLITGETLSLIHI